MSRPRPEDLRGDALRVYETWRTLGMSEAAAMNQVVEGGHVERDPFDEFEGAFRRLGMSPEAAHRAAIGRYGTEAAAREAFADGPPPGVGVRAAAGGAVDQGLREAYAAAARNLQQRGGLSAAEADTAIAWRVTEALSQLAGEPRGSTSPASSVSSARSASGRPAAREVRESVEVVKVLR